MLLRVDFNVPIEDGRIVDDTRIREALPTIQNLVERSARVILITHLGRPDGHVDDGYRTTPLAARLGELMGRPVRHLEDCVGPSIEAAVTAMRDGEVVMLENVRFHPGETKNDPAFARQLAALGEIYVNDAFGTAHRAHASTVGIAQYLPAVAGLLMEREITTLGRIMTDPPHPLVAIIGGSKISTKIGVVRSLLRRVDRLCIGGAMACTFLKARGLEMGRSLVEDDQLEVARSLLSSGATLVLPLDAVKRRAELARDDLLRAPQLMLLERFPQGQNDLQAVAEGRLQLSVQLFVGFIEQLAPLGMADQQVVAPTRQHLRRNLTGERPLILPGSVLRANLDRASAKDIRDLPEHQRRRQDHDVLAVRE